MAKKKPLRETVPYQKACLFSSEKQVLTSSGRFDRRDNHLNSFQELTEYLDEFAPAYNSMFHTAFSLLYKGLSETEIKRILTKKYGFKSRVVNSAIAQARTDIKARDVLYQRQIEDKENKIEALEEQIENMEADYKELIGSENWSSPAKGAVVRRKKLKFAICRKKDRLNHQRQRLQAMKKNYEEGIPVCFGSRKLFQAQFHLKENGLASHEEWKKIWVQERTKTIYQIGSSDECHGNGICQLTAHEFGYFLVNLFHARSGCETVYQAAVHIPYLRKELAVSVSQPKGQCQSVSVHFKKDWKSSSWYILPTVEKEGVEPDWIPKKMIGIDINDGFFSLAYSDEEGNFIGTEDLKYSNEGTSSQNETSMLTVLSQIHETAEHWKFGIAIESINLSRKKSRLVRSSYKKYNAMLSSFPYTRYCDANESLAGRKGSVLFYVDPAWTSVLGEEKYSELLKISSHQAAAYVIARRAQGYIEFYRKPRKAKKAEKMNRKGKSSVCEKNTGRTVTV